MNLTVILKNVLAVLGVVPVALATAWPHASWLVPATAITSALLGVFHVTPLTVPGVIPAPAAASGGAKASNE